MFLQIKYEALDQGAVRVQESFLTLLPSFLTSLFSFPTFFLFPPFLFFTLEKVQVVANEGITKLKPWDPARVQTVNPQHFAI